MTNRRGIDDQRRNEICARLRTAFAESHPYSDYDQKQIAKRFGVTPQAVSLWFSGQRLPGVENCIMMARALRFSLDWLLLNRGKMRPDAIEGSLYNVADWPDFAQEVIKGMAKIYEEQDSKEEDRK